MSLDILTRAAAAEATEPKAEFESPWVENVVATTAAAMTVLLVSSVAVLMYFA